MHLALKVFALALIMNLAACERGPVPNTGNDAAAATGAQPAAAEYIDARHEADANLPLVGVYKSPTCGCCESWVEHMRSAGFPVEVRALEDLGAIKAEVGVPAGQGSCHTARVGDYFVEGHVPADDVKRLLAEKPDVRGLTVPGMPLGSPGMEQGGVQEAYDVLVVARDGSTSVFAHHGDRGS
jgi:hypothetical protein